MRVLRDSGFLAVEELRLSVGLDPRLGLFKRIVLDLNAEGLEEVGDGGLGVVHDSGRPGIDEWRRGTRGRGMHG
jgi:hypothetical protein